MPKSSIDLQKDLLDLAEAAAMLREEIELYKSDVEAGSRARDSLSKAGLASNTTKLYAGCERIMEYLAKALDKAPIGRGDGGWHAHLLQRMSEPYADKRPAIISAALFEKLNLLRGFRHVERNSYGLSLDGPIVAERAARMPRICLAPKWRRSCRAGRQAVTVFVNLSPLSCSIHSGKS